MAVTASLPGPDPAARPANANAMMTATPGGRPATPPPGGPPGRLTAPPASPKGTCEPRPSRTASGAGRPGAGGPSCPAAPPPSTAPPPSPGTGGVPCGKPGRDVAALRGAPSRWPRSAATRRPGTPGRHRLARAPPSRTRPARRWCALPGGPAVPGVTGSPGPGKPGPVTARAARRFTSASSAPRGHPVGLTADGSGPGPWNGPGAGTVCDPRRP